MKRKIFSILALILVFASLLSIGVLAQAEGDVTPPPAQEQGMVLKFVPESLGQTVQILATGMIGIFIVTGIIIMVVLLLNTILEIVANKQANKNNKK
ncbi:MAG: hypothetical protein IJ400_06630 [Clostridia bacterium]|nr:hypothetical protein [Clostridia bacterium]